MDDKIIDELADAVMLSDLSGLAEDFRKIESAIKAVAQSDIADVSGFSGEPKVSAAISPDEENDRKISVNALCLLRIDVKNEHDGRELISSYSRCDGKYNSVPRVV